MSSYSSPLIDLGQPGADREAPSTASALVNGSATLVYKSADGETTTVHNGVRSLWQLLFCSCAFCDELGQGRYELEFTRTSATVGNPWRMNKMKAVGIWSTGDAKTMGSEDQQKT